MGMAAEQLASKGPASEASSLEANGGRAESLGRPRPKPGSYAVAALFAIVVLALVVSLTMGLLGG